MAHLTNDQVDAYWSRRLAPADLLSLDGHIGECQRCRETLMAAAPPASWPTAEELAGHLEYPRIEEYVKGTASAEARAGVEGHIAQCAICRAEVEDLRRFRAEYGRHREPARRDAGERPFGIRSRWWLAAGLAAAACVAVVVGRFGGGAPGFPVLLRDAGQSLGLDSHGRLRGLPNLPNAESSVLAGILAGGDLPLAKPREELAGNGGVTRGASEAAAEFAVTDPLGRVTLEDRPVFRWTALAGASSYRVRILDLDYRLVAESPSLSDTQWQPEKALARDRTYSWQVTAVRRGAELHAPQPPSSEARFAVLDNSRADRLTAALAHTPVSHLALSALYAEAGMDRECLQELQALEAENPGSALVARLRAQVTAMEPGQ